jgi:hypothetical protein
MKRENDISNLFQERASQLRQTPRPEAWSRLENRLQSRRQRPKLFWSRNWTLAAGFLLLVGIIGILSTYQPDNETAGSPFAYHPDQVEELAGGEAIGGQLVHQDDYATVAWKEGQPGKNFRVISLVRKPSGPAAEHSFNLAPNSKEDLEIVPALQAYSWLQGQWEEATANPEVATTWNLSDPSNLVGRVFQQTETERSLTEVITIQLEQEDRLAISIRHVISGKINVFRPDETQRDHFIDDAGNTLRLMKVSNDVYEIHLVGGTTKSRTMQRV